MRPVTFSTNKHFIPVANKPLILYPIETVAKTGIKEFAITYNPGGLEDAEALLGNGSRWGISISYVLQKKPAGLANIVAVCEEFLSGDSFVLHLGDNIFVDGINETVEYFQREKPNGLVTMIHHKENKRMGVPFFDDKGHLIKYVEKPQNPPHDFAVPGLYFADSNFFKCFHGEEAIKPSERGEYEIPAAFQWLIDHNFRVDVIEYKGKWLDPGKFVDWIEANRFLLDTQLEEQNEGEVDAKSQIVGKVNIGQGTMIVNSKITGPVIIGQDVQVINSELGPHLSVSDSCKIESSRVKNSVLMSGVIVSNLAQSLETSLIGSESEVVNKDGSDKIVKLFIGANCSVEI